MENVTVDSLPSLIRSGRTWIDVRAPVEFAAGALPGAVNLPLLDDEERARVGTAYKQDGQEAAIRLGHQLVSGPVKEARVRVWLDRLAEDPEAILYCFRGGLRSRTVQAWLAEAGSQRPLLTGGYKAARRFFIHEIDRFSASRRWLVVSGPTGSAKTRFLGRAALSRSVLDLEACARHRGSAFGAWNVPQPTQIDFENGVAARMIRLGGEDPVLVEDESRMIGKCVVPESLFLRMRASPILWIDEPLEARVENVFRDYVLDTDLARGDEGGDRLWSRYQEALRAIGKKLGGLRAAEIGADMNAAWKEQRAGRGLEAHRAWIRRLLVDYYDPFYFRSLERRKPEIWFRGSTEECLQRVRDAATGRTGP